MEPTSPATRNAKSIAYPLSIRWYGHDLHRGVPTYEYEWFAAEHEEDVFFGFYCWLCFGFRRRCCNLWSLGNPAMQLFSDHAWWRNTWQSVKEHIQLLWPLPPEVRKTKTTCNFIRIVELWTASSHQLFKTVLQTPHSCWVRSNLICGETNKVQTESRWKKFCLVNISSETPGCSDDFDFIACVLDSCAAM